jgi:UV DNA damage endonuclease
VNAQERIQACTRSLITTTPRPVHLSGGPSTRFGYACINETLRTRRNANERITTNRKMIKRTWEEKGLAYASKLALQNVQDLLTIIRWNNDHGVQVFRITSDLIPWSTEYELEDLPDWDDILKTLFAAGATAKMGGQRLSFHPGQFNVLASPNPEVVRKTIRELRTHGELMDAMNQPRTRAAKINLHVGGAYGEHEAALARFCEAFADLPDSVATRLTVENDDRASLYSVKMLYEGVYKRVGVPIVFDSHHFELGPRDQDYSEALGMAVSTWGDVRPCCHHSNSRQREDERAVAKAHSRWLYTPFDDCGHDVDVILECKGKDQALARYLREFKEPA